VVQSGQALVEFAIASTLFLTIIFGTIDFGRAIFLSSELHSAVREGSRYGKIHPTQTANIQQAVVDKAYGTGLATGGVSVSCTGSCASGDKLTVSASVQFQAVTQQFLGISPITLSSSNTVDIE
jgi:Flp pilus assembly protein TadG